MKSTEVQKIILCNFNNFIWSVSSTTWSWHWSAVLNYWCRPDMTTQRMPSYVRSSHSVWHIPSKSLVTCDTLTWWPIRGQHPGHVTSGQPIRGLECDLGQCIIRGVKYLISDQADNDIVCQSGIRGGTLAQPSDTAQFQEFYIKRYFKEKFQHFIWCSPFNSNC